LLFLTVFLVVTPLAAPSLAQMQQKCISGICGQVASPPSGLGAVIPDPISSSISFQNWMAPIGDILDSVQAKAIFKTISYAILGIAVFFLCLNLVRAGGLFDGFEFVILRVLIAFAVITAADPLGDLWKDTWHWGYKTSTTNMAQVYAESAQQLSAVATRWPTTMIKMQVLSSSTRGQSSAAVRVAGVSENPLMNFIMSALVPFSGLLYACLSGFYSFAVMASVFTIVFGKILLPLVGASLAFPGSTGTSAFGAWIRAMTSAALAGFFLPLVFALAAFIAILIPISHMQVAMDLVDQVTNAAKTLTAGVTADPSTPNLVQTAIDRLGDVWGWNDLKNNLIRIIAALVVLPFAMLLGLVLAGNVIVQASGWIASLIAGITMGGGYSNLVGGAAVAGASATVGSAAARRAMAVNGAALGAANRAGLALKGGLAGGIRAGVGALESGASAAAAAAAPAARTALTAAALRGVRPSMPFNMNHHAQSAASGPSLSRQGVAGPSQQGPAHPVSVGQMISNARAHASAQGKFVPGGYASAPPSRKKVGG
jgi:hypothetical protein